MDKGPFVKGSGTPWLSFLTFCDSKASNYFIINWILTKGALEFDFTGCIQGVLSSIWEKGFIPDGICLPTSEG